jgi:phosphatidylserine synthase
MAAVALVISLWPLLGSTSPRYWLLAMGLAFLSVLFVRPTALSSLNKGWMRLGELMASVVSPIALGILFFGVITPIGWSIGHRAIGLSASRPTRA